METINEETEEIVDWLTIDDVDDNQFFIDIHNRLCQKIADYSFNIIADENGNPYAEDTQIMYEDEEILKVLPNIYILDIIERYSN